MSRVEHVVFGFLSPEKTAETVVLPDSWELISPAGEDLVGVGLMANVDDQLVVRRVECVVQRDNQFDRSQARPGMPADLGKCFNHILANFVSERLELRLRQFPQVRGIVDL